MTKFPLLTAGLLAGLCLSAPGMAAPRPSASGTRVFHGAWFDIRYPADFRVRPSQRSQTADGYDSAFFTAPDGSVTFYVFLPQWNGDPRDIRLQPGREVLTAHATRRRTEHGYMVTAAWFTARARDGSYTRSWVDTQTSLNSRCVFGIRSRDAASLARYGRRYAAFKASLRGYAD
jgi:hypothetical protein